MLRSLSTSLLANLWSHCSCSEGLLFVVSAKVSAGAATRAAAAAAAALSSAAGTSSTPPSTDSAAGTASPSGLQAGTSAAVSASDLQAAAAAATDGNSVQSGSSNRQALRPRVPRRQGGPQNAPLASPWTPTSMLIKRKTYQKRSRFLIQTLEAEQQRRLAQDKRLDNFRAGDILEVTTVVPEAECKVYTYKGVCIARANKGPRSWFKLYNVFPDAGGFVQHFPLFMPDLLSVKVVGHLPKAKRAQLYHLLEDESPKHIYQTAPELQQS